MYCSNCGATAAGHFCSACGHKLAEVPMPAPLAEMPAAAVLPVDWQHEHRCEALLAHPEVRALIARHAAMAKQGMTGEDFMKCIDVFYKPMVGISLVTVGKFAQPFNEKLGIKTGKERSKRLAMPIGRLIVGAICTLARHGRKLRDIQQTPDGCAIEASLPSDFWSLEGKITVRFHRREDATLVEASTYIGGQWYDWGKSAKCLDELFDEIAVFNPVTSLGIEAMLKAA